MSSPQTDKMLRRQRSEESLSSKRARTSRVSLIGSATGPVVTPPLVDSNNMNSHVSDSSPPSPQLEDLIEVMSRGGATRQPRSDLRALSRLVNSDKADLVISSKYDLQSRTSDGLLQLEMAMEEEETHQYWEQVSGTDVSSEEQESQDELQTKTSPLVERVKTPDVNESQSSFKIEWSSNQSTHSSETFEIVQNSQYYEHGQTDRLRGYFEDRALSDLVIASQPSENGSQISNGTKRTESSAKAGSNLTELYEEVQPDTASWKRELVISKLNEKHNNVDDDNVVDEPAQEQAYNNSEIIDEAEQASEGALSWVHQDDESDQLESHNANQQSPPSAEVDHPPPLKRFLEETDEVNYPDDSPDLDSSDFFEEDTFMLSTPAYVKRNSLMVMDRENSPQENGPDDHDNLEELHTDTHINIRGLHYLQNQRKHIPAVIPRRVMQDIAKSVSSVKMLPDIVETLVEASNEYFDQVSKDVAAYADHAGHKIIEPSDVLLLFKRQRMIASHQSIISVAHKYLPAELVNEVEDAVYGNSVSKLIEGDDQSEDDDDL